MMVGPSEGWKAGAKQRGWRKLMTAEKETDSPSQYSLTKCSRYWR